MSKAPRPRLRLADSGGVTVVHFLDARIVSDETIQDVADQLFNLVDVEGRTKILLNFENVQFLSSNALAKLLALDKKLKARKGVLKLCGLKPIHLEVFRVTKLDGLLQIHDEEQAALAAF
jgi:anti-sigma B factor antagonist